jgi:hypothetical protein
MIHREVNHVFRKLTTIWTQNAKKMVARHGFYHEMHRKQPQRNGYRSTMRSTQNAKYHRTTIARWLRIHNEIDTERKENVNSYTDSIIEHIVNNCTDRYECTMEWTQNAKYHPTTTTTNPQRHGHTTQRKW